MIDDRVHYNRLLTIDPDHIRRSQFVSDPSPFCFTYYLDDYAKKLITSELHLDTSEIKLLENGGRLRVGYWIE